MWFELSGDARLGQCTTDGCGGAPTSRLEADGVGSNYCSGCRSKIEANTELPRLKPPAGDLTVECPKCHQRVSETCCAYQEYEYYKDCYSYITRSAV